MQSQQLLSESQVFKDEALPGPESTDYPPKEMTERRDHGKKLIGKLGSERCAKLFILWVYDVLASHRHLSPRPQQPAHKAFSSLFAGL